MLFVTTNLMPNHLFSPTILKYPLYVNLFSILEPLKASNISYDSWLQANRFDQDPIFKHRKVISATTVDLHSREMSSSTFQQQNITFRPLNVFSSDKILTYDGDFHEKSSKMKSEELQGYRLIEVEDEIKPTFVIEDEQAPVGFDEEVSIYNSEIIPVTETLLTGKKMYPLSFYKILCIFIQI